jgi:hypothetical protein
MSLNSEVPWRPLPVAVPFEEDECGLGLVLRMCRANSISLQRLLDWLRLPGVTRLGLPEVARLAHVVQVSPDWLGSRLPRQISAAQGWAFLKQHWSRALAFRTPSVQVCAQCIHASGYAKAVWRLAGMVACPQHDRLLTMQCTHCGEPVMWNRPSIDVCRCGRHLAASDASPSSGVRSWCQWLEARAWGRVPDVPRRDDVPTWLDQLSADGAWCLVYSFGVRDRPHARVSARLASHAPDLPATAQLIDRGLQNLRSIDPLSPTSIKAAMPFAHEQALEGLADNGVWPADRSIAERWLEWIQQRPLRGRVGSGRWRSRQLALF